MKAKNFLFTAVLTFGAILFATNVSAQTAVAGPGTGTTGGITGDVELVLKLQDFQELKVNAPTSKVVFTFDSKDDYTNTTLAPAVAKAANQLTAFSTKKFNITVAASEFMVGTTPLTGVLGLFTVQATNNDPNGVTTGDAVTLTGTATNLFKNAQVKTRVATGYNIDINYSLTNPSAILNTIGVLATETKNGTEDVYTTKVTYTILPG